MAVWIPISDALGPYSRASDALLAQIGPSGWAFAVSSLAQRIGFLALKDHVMQEKIGAIIGIVFLGVVLLIAALLILAPPEAPDPDDMPNVSNTTFGGGCI